VCPRGQHLVRTRAPYFPLLPPKFFFYTFRYLTNLMHSSWLFFTPFGIYFNIFTCIRPSSCLFFGFYVYPIFLLSHPPPGQGEGVHFPI
jgi:hypothetical protein